ncbi:MAG TPA: hypothetical protein VKU44_03730 [Terriglobia bacterium]|nr:hypothetical protein [Terriglobia bacterium]
MSDNLAIVMVVFIIAGGFVTIMRALLDYRRSVTLVRAQADAHVKLMEKLASSQELLAYIETDAGKQFLQLTAVGAERPRGPQFPFGRILWSVQAGLILLLAGLGFNFLRSRVTDPGATDGFLVLGTLGVVVGLGFLASAAASYVISKHLGLLEREPAARRAA